MIMMRMIRSGLPHILIILSGIFIVFLILDNYNPTMDFLGNTVSIQLFWFFCIMSILNSVLIIEANRKEWRNKSSEGSSVDMERPGKL